MKILIVDDSTINNILLQNLLEEEGFEVISILNGYDALEIIQNHNIGLILLDIMMPDFTGLDLLRHLNSKNVKIPVIIISASDNMNYKLQSLDLGAKDYMTKPIQFKLLLKKIKKIMAYA